MSHHKAKLAGFAEIFYCATRSRKNGETVNLHAFVDAFLSFVLSVMFVYVIKKCENIFV